MSTLVGYDYEPEVPAAFTAESDRFVLTLAENWGFVDAYGNPSFKPLLLDLAEHVDNMKDPLLATSLISAALLAEYGTARPTSAVPQWVGGSIRHDAAESEEEELMLAEWVADALAATDKPVRPNDVVHYDEDAGGARESVLLEQAPIANSFSYRGGSGLRSRRAKGA